MQFRRYWSRETATVAIAGEKKEIHCYGSSDVSLDDARVDARRKAARIEKRIAGDENAFRDYEPVIREEIIETLDSHNVVTRTRYGALILNSENTVFIDIDKPPSRFWKNLFAWRGLDDKARIRAHVGEVAAQADWQACGFRIYETHSGVRVIVTGAAMEPGSAVAAKLFESLNADPLYAFLCDRQGCFRARLTAKPERVGIQRFRVDFPRDDEQQRALDKWLPLYESAGARFGVCRFLEELGQPGRSAMIDLHDRLTQAHRQMPLA